MIEEVEALPVPTIVLVDVSRRVMQQRDEDAALHIAAILHHGQVVRRPLSARCATWISRIAARLKSASMAAVSRRT